MNYQDVKSNTVQFLSLTTLYLEEFSMILLHFSQEWYKFYRVRTLEGKRRKKTNWRPEKDTPTLPTVEDKLFFLLTYYKQHPLQQFHAATFGLSQAKVSLWVKLLTPMLEQSLVQLNVMPCREGSGLTDFLNRFGQVGTLSQDVVEQTMPRPVDDAAQEAMYSGKKKSIPTKTRSTVKTINTLSSLAQLTSGQYTTKKLPMKKPANIRRA